MILRTYHYSLSTNHFKVKLGFTLIELMVVITIIAILGSIGYFAFDNALDRGRDNKRKQELKAVQGALTSYYQDKGQYPPPGNPSPCTEPTIITSDGTQNWFSEIAPYLKDQKLPNDPRQASVLQNLLAKLPKFNLGTSAPQKAVNTHPEVAGTVTDSPFTALTSDGYLTYNAATQPAENGTCSSSTTGTYLAIGQDWQAGPIYYAMRGHIGFDTSAIPDNATITSAKLRITMNGKFFGTNSNVNLRNYNWGTSLTCGADWGGNPPTSTNVINSVDTSVLPSTSGTSYDLTFTSGGLSSISKTSSSYFILTTSREESNAVNSAAEYFRIDSANYSTTSYRPQLLVSYTYPDPTPTPVPTPTPTPTPVPTPTPSPSAAPSPTPTPAPSPTPTPLPSPTPTPAASPTPSPTPPPYEIPGEFAGNPLPPEPPASIAPGGSIDPLYDCNGKDEGVYCYIVSADRSYFLLWTKLDNIKDNLSIFNVGTQCRYLPPSTKFNFCLEAQK